MAYRQKASNSITVYSIRGEQNVKPAIVFRRKGNVSSEEKAEYDKGVDV